MANFKLNFVAESKQTEPIDEFQNRNKPFCSSNVFCTSIQNFKILTTGEDVRTVYDLELSRKDISYDFLPGDTIAILPCNNKDEVNKLLIRLELETVSNKKYELEVLKTAVNKRMAIPKHVPVNGTLTNLFTKYVDIRKPPKKLFLKSLLEYVKDPIEYKHLELICSAHGSKEYHELINKNRTLLGILDVFPSCEPPVELLLQHSSPLQPRYYSISSSPLKEDTLNITFFIVENDDGTRGVCTGWLEHIILKENTCKIPFYFCKVNNFRLTDLSRPLILIATGTGLAPFRGFLQHILLLQNNKQEYCITDDVTLFYGCRYHRDFLFEDEIYDFIDDRIVRNFKVCFSRESDSKYYIQNEIMENGDEFMKSILEKDSLVYVCGDANSLVKDLKQTVIDCLIKFCCVERSAAEEVYNNLVKDNRYIIDTWT